MQFWVSILKILSLIGLAVFTFIGYRQTDRQAKYIYIEEQKIPLVPYEK